MTALRIRADRRWAAPVAGVGLLVVLAVLGPADPLLVGARVVGLVATPALAAAAAVRGLDPLGRVVAALGAAVVVDGVVAETMVAAGVWSLRGGAIAVGAISLLLLLLSGRQPRAGRGEEPLPPSAPRSGEPGSGAT